MFSGRLMHVRLEAADLLDTTHQTASSLIRDFEKLDILKKAPKVERSQVYIFQRYLSLFADEPGM